MDVLVVTGIFPPAIGGPATHAADVTAELEPRGHRVTVLTLSDVDGGSRPTRRRPDRSSISAPWSWPRRSLRMVAWMAAHRRGFDVVYATGLGPVAVAGARLARRPVILKFVADPAWERVVREDLSNASFTEFQRTRAPAGVRSAHAMATRLVGRRATAVVTPSPQPVTARGNGAGVTTS